MNDRESPSMIWRHVLIALPEVEFVPDYVLDRSGRIARGLDAQVELFHCIYDPSLMRDMPPGSALRERIRARVEEKRRHLERVADRLREQGLDVRTSVRWDFPIFEAIVRQVLRSGPSLLIVPAGASGHARAPRGATGINQGIAAAGPAPLTYTDARLIEVCPCPLLLLRTEQVYREGPVVAAIDPGHAHDKPAELDDRIVAAAKTLSSALADAPVHVYHAVPPPSPQAAASEAGRETGPGSPTPERQGMRWVGRDH